MTTPTQLPNESLRAFDAFKRYVELGNKRSIRRLCRKHGRGRAIIEKWSKKYRWQKRIRDMLLEDAKRSARAADHAALKVAEENERLRLRHTEQKLKASELLFAKAREVLRQSAKKSRAPDAAKMFLVASTLGNEALRLEGSAQAGHFSLHPIAPPNITVIHRRDGQSDVVDAIRRQFLRENPDDPAAGRADADELRETADADAQLLRVWRDGNRSSN